MRTPLVAGNWKMNGDRESAVALATGLTSEIAFGSGCDVAVFPPYVYIEAVAGALRSSGSVSAIRLGAQNVEVEEKGAVTGGVAAAMLRDLGCSMVIVGHSERRSMFGESDDLVAAKFARAADAGLAPIVCVGESLEERKAGKALDVVRRQLSAVLDLVGAGGLAKGCVAYEPVWAIGTGESATPEQAQEVHLALRELMASSDAGLGESVNVLYGGSVTPENAGSLFAQQDIDGALVGGASLKVADFAEICRAAANG